MQRLLCDHARQRGAQRRGGGEHKRLAIEPDMLGTEEDPLDLLAIDEALTKLAKIDQRQSKVVVLHFFGGYTLSETAKLLEVSVGTVKADWRMAKAWLHRELTRDTDRP